MTYERETEGIAFLLENHHRLEAPRFEISAWREKDEYVVKVRNVDNVFQKSSQAATFYRQTHHFARMNEAMEHASKVVASWPEWKRNLLR